MKMNMKAHHSFINRWYHGPCVLFPLVFGIPLTPFSLPFFSLKYLKVLCAQHHAGYKERLQHWLRKDNRHNKIIKQWEPSAGCGARPARHGHGRPVHFCLNLRLGSRVLCVGFPSSGCSLQDLMLFPSDFLPSPGSYQPSPNSPVFSILYSLDFAN